jgi:hypothetical protein
MSDPGPSEAEIRALLVADLFDGDDTGVVTMEVAHFATTAAEIVVEHLAEIDEGKLYAAIEALPTFTIGTDYTPVVEKDRVLALVGLHVEPDLDVARLATALACELHVDEAHGFPPGFTARDLAVDVALAYHRLLGGEG